jgi:Flp pilus assembly protein TadD
MSRALSTLRRPALAALLLAGAATLPGCASSGVSPMTTGSVSRSGGRSMDAMKAGEIEAAVRSYGAAYQRSPQDKGVGLAYASALRMTGRNDQSLAVMQQVAISHPKDRDVLASYGKALAAAGELEKALDTVRRAQTPDYPDWRLFSAEGAILDQLGRADEARVYYRKALDIQPNEPSVLSNLGMSHLLANDLRSAESYLRSAARLPGADSRVRQNLALVVGLQGRFEEAQTIASAELDPAEAAANVAYLKSMLDQQNTWSMLKARDGAAPPSDG